MSKMRVVTVDSDKLRAEVASMRAESTLYHDWDGLNNNACMPAFKEVKERLDKLDPNESAASLENDFAPALFQILEQWAYRSKEPDNYGIYAAHQAMVNAGSSEEAKREFIQKCALIKDNNGNEKWTHNQAEVLVGKALLDIIDKKPPQEIKTNLDNALIKYTEVCANQVRKDIARGRVMFDSEGRTALVTESGVSPDGSYTDLLPENFPELTGEQVGFVKNLWGQGKYEGGWFVPLATSSTLNGTMIHQGSKLNDKIPSSCFIKQTRDAQGGKRTYVVMSKKLQEVDIKHISDGDARYIDRGTYTAVVDISELKGESFTIGCASADVPSSFIIEATEETMKALNIPDSLRSDGMSEADRRLLKEISTDIPKATEKEMEIRKFFASSVDKVPEDRLVEYFAIQLKPGTTVGKEHKNQMRDDVIRILTPLAKDDQVKQKALKDIADIMVRDCVAIASSEDPTVKLSFGQKIRHVVATSLKALFGLSKEKKEFRDIVGKDFATSLKENLTKPTDGQSHRGMPPKAPDSGRAR